MQSSMKLPEITPQITPTIKSYKKIKAQTLTITNSKLSKRKYKPMASDCHYMSKMERIQLTDILFNTFCLKNAHKDMMKHLELKIISRYT